MEKTPKLIPFMEPIYIALAPFTALALRLVAGLFLVPHGAQKLFGWFGGYGLEATGQYFSSAGMANGYAIALSAGLVEFVGGLALAIGLLTRVSAAATTILLLVALSVHIPNGFFWTSSGYEYPVVWSLLTFSFWVNGGGAYSIDRLIGREF
jgi:putative oxidoreductase